jgi:hypothetical protein
MGTRRYRLRVLISGGGSLPPEPKPRLNRRGETPLQYDFYLKAFFIIPFIINAIDKIISSDKLSNLVLYRFGIHPSPPQIRTPSGYILQCP